MRKTLLTALVALAPTVMVAQSAIDALNLSQTELRGTARFMSMGGAFTALGGDLSTLNQNPAGIGIYRGSDVGFTFDIDMQSAKVSAPQARSMTTDQTKVNVNNVGYVGTFNLSDQVFKSISFGFTYSRIASFNRKYRGQGLPMKSSLSNYIASFTNGVNPGEMEFNNPHNSFTDPYDNPSPTAPNWLSILAYSGGIVNPIVQSDPASGLPIKSSEYDGLWEYNIDPTTSGRANFMVNEEGYVDEYSINFGGNLANTVYWGLGLGITDIRNTQNVAYGEELDHANVPTSDADGIEEGSGGFTLSNWKRTHGTGVNIKFGLIFKPVNEFRLGLAIHSPTWYNLTTEYNATINSNFSSGWKADDYTNNDYYDWKLQTPWRLMFGAAGVIGGKGIISADYEYQAYKNMKVQDGDGYDIEYFNDDIKDYTKSSNTLRLGLEYRFTPQFSGRLGYVYTDANTKQDVRDSNVEVITSGTNPAYTLDDNIQYVTGGLGYRYKGFYIDMAVVYKHRVSDYHAFASFKEYDDYWTDGPKARVVNNNTSLVFTLGFKF